MDEGQFILIGSSPSFTSFLRFFDPSIDRSTASLDPTAPLLLPLQYLTLHLLIALERAIPRSIHAVSPKRDTFLEKTRQTSL